MNNFLKNSIAIVIVALLCHTKIFSTHLVGHISGKLLLDDSWERRIYVSFIESLEKEYAISNNLITTDAVIDSFGKFKINLDKFPDKWSLLRLHIVQKGTSPYSLVIGSKNENFFFLIAKRDSEIEIYNTWNKPIFDNIRVENASYMETFEYVRKLANYSSSINYEESIIEKEFITEVVSEKLKALADTCKNPLVSLYALHQTNFQKDYHNDPTFYENFLSKWKRENSPYFESFRSKFPNAPNTDANQNILLTIVLLLICIGFVLWTVIFFYKKRGQQVKKLSIQERKIFDLLREGLSNKEISAACNIELSTVKSHVSNIYSKLKIKSRKEAIHFKIKPD